MERFTISLDGALLEQFLRYMERKGYKNRSEAVRDLLRERLEAIRQKEDEKSDSIACLSYIYNHHERELPRRLAETQHIAHGLVRSTTHVHYDDENCMEIAILLGKTAKVRSFAEAVIAETGVHHGRLNVVTIEKSSRPHQHRRKRVSTRAKT